MNAIFLLLMLFAWHPLSGNGLCKYIENLGHSSSSCTCIRAVIDCHSAIFFRFTQTLSLRQRWNFLAPMLSFVFQFLIGFFFLFYPLFFCCVIMLYMRHKSYCMKSKYIKKYFDSYFIQNYYYKDYSAIFSIKFFHIFVVLNKIFIYSQ